MTLKGVDGLRHRLEAMERSTRTIPPKWGQTFVRVAQPMIPVRTGATRRSVHLAEAGADSASIRGSAVAVLIDTGTRAHEEDAGGGVLRFPVGPRTVFARRVHHPGTRARKWRRRAAEEAARRTRMADTIIEAWNRAD